MGVRKCGAGVLTLWYQNTPDRPQWVIPKVKRRKHWAGYAKTALSRSRMVLSFLNRTTVHHTCGTLGSIALGRLESTMHRRGISAAASGHRLLPLRQHCDVVDLKSAVELLAPGRLHPGRYIQRCNMSCKYHTRSTASEANRHILSQETRRIPGVMAEHGPAVTHGDDLNPPSRLLW